ncbi:proteasome accessory factor PafA2 family protein [Candidatus Saccharibacteria bacterium]|nr:proteasome accessory factor PafA2 family protein [Candidatus Saccharibacteria bacterium]
MKHTQFNAAAYEHETPVRFFGSETEFSMPLPVDTDPEECTASLVDILPDQEILASGNYGGVYMAYDGGITYLDHGNVVECSTPECASAMELALHERVAEARAATIAQYVRDKYDMASTAYKRSGWAEITDPKNPAALLFEELSTGHHENYHAPGLTMHGSSFPRERRLALQAILATRKTWTGTGMVTQTAYLTTQKPAAIDYIDGNSQTSHGNKIPWRANGSALEIRDGEGNMSEWVIRHKYALTSLALRMLEHDCFPEGLYLENPNHAVASIAINPSASVQLANGRSMPAIDHQYALYDSAVRQLGDTLPDEEINAFVAFESLWKGYKEIDFDKMEVTPISDRVDWAAKLDHMLLRNLEPTDIHGGNFGALSHDLEWEDVSTKGPAREWYRKYGNEQITSSDVLIARTKPPQTRAARRVSLVLAKRNEDSASMTVTMKGWSSLEIDGVTYPLGDPS